MSTAFGYQSCACFGRGAVLASGFRRSRNLARGSRCVACGQQCLSLSRAARSQHRSCQMGYKHICHIAGGGEFGSTRQMRYMWVPSGGSISRAHRIRRVTHVCGKYGLHFTYLLPIWHFGAPAAEAGADTVTPWPHCSRFSSSVGLRPRLAPVVHQRAHRLTGSELVDMEPGHSSAG